jgi:ParB family transcriptional regulator, chromosome partitioning protein
METVQTTHPTSVYCDLPLVQLQESASNPRRRYHAKRLDELAQSFQAQGVLEPLLVRALEPERYEIVAGSRRYRAAKLAGLETVPVKVVEMTAQQALEAQCVENLQREDVHPLEEAQAFANLIAQGHDVATIAARIGKTPTFVTQRLRLTELVPSIAEAFLEGKIPLAHATLIARLPEAQQPEAFTAAFRSVYLTGGQTSLLVPVKELAGWIEENLLLDLDKVPFDKTDATLLPDAGNCDQCSKRTGFNALLFPDATADRCTDRACFQAKIDCHIARQKEHKPELIMISTAWGPKSEGILGRNEYTVVTATAKGKRKTAGSNPAQQRCPYVTDALVTEGTDRGQTLTICANPNCEVHHAESKRAREEQVRERAERHKQEETRKIELATRQRTLTAILGKIESPLSKANLQLIGSAFFEHLPQECRTALAKRHKADASQFIKEAPVIGA